MEQRHDKVLLRMRGQRGRRSELFMAERNVNNREPVEDWYIMWKNTRIKDILAVQTFICHQHADNNQDNYKYYWKVLNSFKTNNRDEREGKPFFKPTTNPLSPNQPALFIKKMDGV